MVRGQGRKKELYSSSDIQTLKDEKRELETSIQEAEQARGAIRGVDIPRMKQEISRIDEKIHEGTPGRIRGGDKDALAKEERELEDKISAGMPSRYEMRKPTENPGAVRKHLEWDKRNKENIQRYVQIQRMLRPEEPKSIEVLRKDR